MRTGALLALAISALPAVSAAAIVTITGKIASYQTTDYSYFFDENGDLQSSSSSSTFTHGGYVGDAYTITLDVENGSVLSQQITSAVPEFHVYDLGTYDPAGGYSAASNDNGSGSADSRSVNVSISGLGSFFHDSGNLDGDAGGESTLWLHLVPKTAAIPEPATWALMLIGLAGIGGVMRSKPPVSISYDV